MKILHYNVLLVIVYITLYFPRPSCASFSEARLDTNANDLNQLFQGQAGIYPDTSLTLLVKINVSFFTPHLKVDVVFPHTVSYGSKCFTYSDGSTFNCINNTNYHYKLGNVPSDNDVSVSLDQNVVVDSSNLNKKESTLSWSFTNITSTTASSSSSIVISIKVNPQQNANSQIGSTHQINAHIFEGTTSVSNLSETVKILGPSFDVASSSGNAVVQAGDVVNHTLTLTLATRSTSAAKNVQVVVTLPTHLKYVSNSVTPNSVSMGANELKTTLATMDKGQSFQMQWRSDVMDTVPLGQSISTLLKLTYSQNVTPDHSFYREYHHWIDCKDITFPSVKSNFGFENESMVHVGDEFEWTTRFTMPPGTVYGSTLNAVFQAADITLTPVFGNVELDDSIQKKNLPSSYILTNGQSQRKKRTVQPTTTSFLIGTLTNKAANNNPAMLVTINARYHFSALASPSSFSAQQSYWYFNKRLYSQSSPVKTINQPFLTIHKVVQMVDDSVYPNIVRFNVTVKHAPHSNLTAHKVKITDIVNNFQILLYDGMTPTFGTPGLTFPNGNTVQYILPTLPVGSEMFLSFKAEPVQDGEKLPNGDSNYTANLEYYSSANSTFPVEKIDATVCIKRQEIVKSNLFLNHGFTVLMVLVGILIGFVLAFLLLFILFKLRKLGSIQPAKGFNTVKLRGLLTDTKAAFKKGFNALKDLSMVAVDESLILILSLKDKLRIHRELDSLDIVNTIGIDTEIENERNDAMIDNTRNLVDSLHKNGDLDKTTQDKCVGKFNMNLKGLDKKLDDEYNKEMGKIAQKLADKNKTKLEELSNKHETEMENLENTTKGLPDKEQDELKRLLKEQQKTEQDELTYRLKLEQDEAAERLRKEFAIKKRMGIKEEQVALLGELANSQQLQQQQVDWLMKQHKEGQASISILYDEEILKQRVKLEEKLARRKGIAATSEKQEEMQSDLLNSMASQQLALIQRAKKLGTLTPEQAEAMMEEVKTDMMQSKDKFDKEREKQELALHKRLSERKRAAMMDQEKKHEQEMVELEKSMKDQASGEILDPLLILEKKQKLKSHQRLEASDLENDIDKEHADELMNLRDALSQQVEDELNVNKQELIKKLNAEGMTEDQMEKLLRKHDKELEQLKEAQGEEREKQEEHLKRELAKRRKEMNKRKEEERLEQEQLREHENQIVDQLLNKQLAMSDSERDRIMKEHEKNMMTIENSMALTKLQQKRMLEEKLAMKRSQQLEQLEKKQMTESKKKKKSKKYEDEDEEEEGGMSRAQVAMMKRHAEQRLAVSQGEQIELDQELEEVQEEMMKARATALKDQEIRLAAMLADLQMQKAKEISRIEDQQKAITSLKSNLMDDLNEKGVLSDPDCQKVLNIHRHEQDKLNERLESQKSKQESRLKKRLMERIREREQLLENLHSQELTALGSEVKGHDKMLQKRLADRLKQREKSLIQLQENQIQEVYHSSAGSMAAKIRIAALRHKHAAETDKFRSKMEKEMMQNLEELRRQIEIQQMQAQQNQELQFLSGLVRLGQFQIDELQNVVDMLFPLKSPEEKKSVLESLTEGYTPPPAQQNRLAADTDAENLNASMNSSLEMRIKHAQAASGRESYVGSQTSVHKKKKSKKKKVPTATLR